MPYSQEQKEYHSSRIRSVIVIRPGASLRDIQSALEDSVEAPMRLDLHYIAKLRDKIMAERTHRNNNLNKGARLAALQDKFSVVAQRLWIEATNQKNPGVVRVMALEKLIKLDNEILQSEMDAGLYERALGTLELARKPLSEQEAGRILTAFSEWGILPEPKKVEAISAAPEIPAHAEQTTGNS